MPLLVFLAQHFKLFSNFSSLQKLIMLFNCSWFSLAHSSGNFESGNSSASSDSLKEFELSKFEDSDDAVLNLNSYLNFRCFEHLDKWTICMGIHVCLHFLPFGLNAVSKQCLVDTTAYKDCTSTRSKKMFERLLKRCNSVETIHWVLKPSAQLQINLRRCLPLWADNRV